MNALTHPTRLDIKDVPAYLKDLRILQKELAASGESDAEAAIHIVECVRMIKQEIRRLQAEIQVKRNFYARTKNAHYAEEMQTLRARIDYYTARARA